MRKLILAIPCDKCGKGPVQHHILGLSGKLPVLCCECPRSVHGDYKTTWPEMRRRWNEHIETFDDRAYGVRG
jgi:hypothetical protein